MSEVLRERDGVLVRVPDVPSDDGAEGGAVEQERGRGEVAEHEVHGAALVLQVDAPGGHHPLLLDVEHGHGSVPGGRGQALVVAAVNQAALVGNVPPALDHGHHGLSDLEVWMKGGVIFIISNMETFSGSLRLTMLAMSMMVLQTTISLVSANPCSNTEEQFQPTKRATRQCCQRNKI